MASYELWFRQTSNAIIDSIFHRLVAQCSTLLQNVIAWFYSPHPVNVQTLLLHWIRRMHTKCAFSIDMFNKRFNEFLFPSNATEVHFRCQWPKQVACIRLAKLNALLCSVIYSYVCIVFLKLRNVDDDDDDDGYDGGNNDDDGDDGERKLVEELINGTNNNCALFRHAALDSLNYNSFPFGFFFLFSLMLLSRSATGGRLAIVHRRMFKYQRHTTMFGIFWRSKREKKKENSNNNNNNSGNHAV